MDMAQPGGKLPLPVGSRGEVGMTRFGGEHVRAPVDARNGRFAKARARSHDGHDAVRAGSAGRVAGLQCDAAVRFNRADAPAEGHEIVDDRRPSRAGGGRDVVGADAPRAVGQRATAVPYRAGDADASGAQRERRTMIGDEAREEIRE